MSDEQETIQQLLQANEKLNLRLHARHQIDSFSLDPFPRQLCQLGATLKQQENGPNPMADDCFAAALEYTSMCRVVKHRQESERKAYLELQRIANLLETTVDDLPRVASKLMDNSHRRDFSPHDLLGMASHTRNMILRAANTYGCKTLASVADLPDEKFLAVQHLGQKTLLKIRTAFSFGDADEI